MRILITGAGGFIGRKLVSLLTDHSLVAADKSLALVADEPHVDKRPGDLCDSGYLASLLDEPFDAVAHLATVPGGAAEQNPELAWQVNVEATKNLATRLAEQGASPRFVYASSIAVYGNCFPESLTDFSPTAPTLHYGAHKLMMEQWLATQSRRGDLAAISLRIPGVVARPRTESGMKSAFLSEMFHAARAQENYCVPVEANATSLIASTASVAEALKRILVSADKPLLQGQAINLPALRVRMEDLARQLDLRPGFSTKGFRYQPDYALQQVFASHGEMECSGAKALGVSGDADLAALIESAAAALT